jgi:hypothetical protein
MLGSEGQVVGIRSSDRLGPSSADTSLDEKDLPAGTGFTAGSMGTSLCEVSRQAAHPLTIYLNRSIILNLDCKKPLLL